MKLCFYSKKFPLFFSGKILESQKRSNYTIVKDGQRDDHFLNTHWSKNVKASYLENYPKIQIEMRFFK
ncbi:hypothetical protein WQ54_02405 [Bacillus sp. SA1-12]|nr:hypothetical protein WQ54_02405 [Bacillus sp. SA1-12]